MIYLNAGNLWTKEYLDRVIELNAVHKDSIKVKSIFGSISKLTPTARSADRIPYLEWNEIDRYVRKAQDNDIAIRYTLNASCFGAMQDFKDTWEAKLKDDIRELHTIGVHEWIVTSAMLLMELRDMFPDDFIEVSTIAEISTAFDATRWVSIGADGVNISTSINRDFGAIKSIVKTGIAVSILANEACLYRCPYRRDCYNLSSHDSERSDRLFGYYPFRHCNVLRMNDPIEWVKARLVFPQWMKLYQAALDVNWFKVAFRTHPYERAIPILEMYMNQAHNGNLLDLWPTIKHLGDTDEPQARQYISMEVLDKEDFFSRSISAGNDCASLQCGIDCTLCNTMLKRAERNIDGV